MFLISIENANGGAGNDTLLGNNSVNRLNGDGGQDKITGNNGADILTGGFGNDTFIFDDGDTGLGVANRDVITDFVKGSDKLDLRMIDARLNQGGDQAFATTISLWNGTGNEFAANAPGSMRYHYETIDSVQYTIIDLNNDNDSAADAQIALLGTFTFSNTSDFLL